MGEAGPPISRWRHGFPAHVAGPVAGPRFGLTLRLRDVRALDLNCLLRDQFAN